MLSICGQAQNSSCQTAPSDTQCAADLERHTCEGSAINLAVQARPSSASLAKLRVSSAAQRKKAYALPACYPTPKTAAMLVVQRTIDRAQQVQV